MIYIARLCIAWLAAHLKLRFMTDRRLGIQHNPISLLCLSFMSISFVHPSCHVPYGWLKHLFFPYSWYVAFQSVARKAWIPLFRFEFKVYRENICPVPSSQWEFPSKVASSSILLSDSMLTDPCVDCLTHVSDGTWEIP
ncbi:hypothetical protein BJX68DRAFT_169607 [Aspergillus pseudodeflectus]|uniref:Uncharacterized protein n=1 Tax=Aspergillus pseudodeflectus TaxID=176178 RepID=A0ABR4JP67_9EURO